MQNVVAAIDFSDMTEPTLAAATEMVKLSGGTLWLLNVAAPVGEFAGHQLGRIVVEEPPPDELRENFEALGAMARQLRTEGLDVHSRMVRGETVPCVLDEAGRMGVDLIVLGSHGHGALYRSFVGSVSEGVLRGAHCPVLIVPSRKGE